MPVTDITAPVALVLVDLQCGITALPTVHPADEVVERSARLASLAHDAGWTVVRTRVEPDPAAPPARTDAAPPAIRPAADFAELDPRVPLLDSDLVVTKRAWDAFVGTGLDLALRRRSVKTLLLAGISTSIGVESTARSARELGYEIVVASDAVTDLVASAHDDAVATILPRLARLATTEELLRTCETMLV
ncbi:nicotinamidase-related amidase [Motilibacter rhizosphaerae]|uniref:Nicotinamidase-related amidase n=1 Tax=Motilibacter rhizosphaerae TaxID=598652 RepID=A0A4Q7NUT8_9ACTN|nr:isochorismatase family protein [Motilibacter rhizosphaerae]RZS90854.1 nicotinamidase-related amidase [Motilibacter rhizosphaerae]